MMATKVSNTKASFTETLDKLRALERSEAVNNGEGDGQGGDEDEGAEDEVVYEEEELEDETDYNFTYFDNGEEYGDYDDGDEGPVY